MARSKKKENLIDMAIKNLDYDALLEFAKQNRYKKHPFSFLDTYKNRPESEINETINNLWKMLVSCMEKYLTGNAAENWASSDAKNCEMTGKVIQVTVDIALITLQLKYYMQCHVELAMLLNSILPAIPSTLDSVKNCIAQYCEKLCLTNFSDRSEYFLYNVFLYLFQKTLRKRVLKHDIKRIYAIRHKLEIVLTMKETKSDEMWEMFKKCAASEPYISILEGQKLIALTMVLDIDKILEIHQVIRAILPETPLKTAPAYGKVYFEAWCYSIKKSKNDIRNVIEISCLQDFILTAIRAGRRHVLPVIRKILAEFHYHKKEQEVSKMLYCLYQPLLWRFLKNPDGLVRANAAQLFLDIFPLEDPEVKVVATDLELNDQLLMIRDLLVDDFPIVRITAVLGICVSMSVNWEVYPEEMLKTYFRIIVDDLSRDSSTHEVRCAVVKGLKCLLENPLTLRCLVSVLPKMGGLFHDVSENVRIAFCQLLLRVKKISAIKYFHVVPVNHLFARLEEDCHSVQKSITNLLNNSYFPQNEDPKVWLGRCLEILKTERNASRVFFTYVSYFVGLEGSIKFMIQATKAIHFYVKTKNTSSPGMNLELCDKENIHNIDEYFSNLEEAVGFNNMKTVATVMDALAVMWLSLKVDVDKPENKYFLKMLVGKIGQPLADLCLYYKDSDAWESVFYISSFLPPSVVPSLGSLCFWRLKNLSHDAKPEDYITLLECLCNQRQVSELLTILKEWIEMGLSDSYVSPPSAKRRRRSRKSSENILEQPKPYLANRMLNSMISHRSLQKYMVFYPKAVADILNLVDHIKRKLERFNVKVINEVEANFLGLLMYNMLRLAVFLHNENHMDGVKYITEIVEWTDRNLIQHLTFSEEGTDNFTTLVYSICMNLSKVMADVTALGFTDPNSQTYLLYFEKLLSSGLGYKYALITSRFLYKHAAAGQFIYMLDDNIVMSRHLLDSLCKIFKYFCNETLLESIPSHEYKDVQFTLGNVMQIVHNYVNKLNKPTSLVFKCVLSSVLDSINEKTNEVVEEMTDDPFNKISFPKVGAFFMYIVNQKEKLVPTYVKFLSALFKSSKKDISHWIAVWIILYDILGRKDMSKPILQETNILVYNLEKSLQQIYPRAKDCQPSNSQESPESPQMQIFQRHCHAEFLKLKNRQFALVAAVKKAAS